MSIPKNLRTLKANFEKADGLGIKRPTDRVISGGRSPYNSSQRFQFEFEFFTKLKQKEIIFKIHTYRTSHFQLMPCPFTGRKMFCAGPNFLCRTNNVFTYCASQKHFVPDKKMICIQ